jgi:hypothetical protein
MNFRVVLLWIAATAASTLLSGEWKNVRDSAMSLQAAGGVLSGQFVDALGNGCPLIGLYNNESILSTVGFCVACSPAATTCWTGYIAADRILLLTWLRTESPLSVADQWRVNTLNTDVFYKQ